MAFILSTGAVLRMLSADPDDPLVAWIERERVRPFLAITTMASVRHEIRTSDALSPAEQAVMERRYDRVARDIRGGRREQVTAAVFDMNSAEILSDLLLVPAVRDILSDMDLVPAAIAMQHNYQLVITDEIEAWQALSAGIAPDIGRLDLLPHPTATA